MLNTFQQARHPALMTPTHDEASRQEFTKSLRQFCQSRLLPGLTPMYEKREATNFERAHGRPPADRREIRAAMAGNLYFQTYALTNRVAQEMLWDSVITNIQRELPELIERAKTLSAGAPGKLDIPAGFPVPNYITAIDIHCMPGGYAGENCTDDIAAGLLYDRGAYLYGMGYVGPMADDMGRSVAHYVKERFPDLRPRRILDMGCTIGNTTLPYKDVFPNAEVWGIDVAGPQIRYAHARGAGLGYDVNFAQRNAEATGFPDGHFDLIVSHMLLHETSGKAMPRIFHECHRLLAPGGIVVHSELPPFDDDPVSQFILDNETWYNNEPFWGAMREADQEQMSVDAGFAPDRVYFDTTPMLMMAHAEESAAGYNEDAARQVARRDYIAGEYAPGGGWSVLVAHKPAALAPDLAA